MRLRIEKVNSLLHQHISEFFSQDISFKPSVFVTITRIDTSDDLRYSKAFVSVFPQHEEPYVIQTLRRESKNLQSTLFKKIGLKPFPHISFVIDSTEQNAQKIEDILRNIHEDNS